MLASIYDEPSFEKAYPVPRADQDPAGALRIPAADARPTPDVTLAIQDALSPTSSIDPNTIVSTLRSEIKNALSSEALL